MIGRQDVPTHTSVSVGSSSASLRHCSLSGASAAFVMYSVQIGASVLVAARGARTDIILLHCCLRLHRIVDFAIMPFGFTFHRWRHLAVPGVLLGTLRIRPIGLFACKYHRD